MLNQKGQLQMMARMIQAHGWLILRLVSSLDLSWPHAL